jgi:predicted LPLAT superfamily acyltransferase
VSEQSSQAHKHDSAAPAWMSQKERGSVWLIRLMSWIAIGFGRRVARCILPFIAFYFSVTSIKARRASTQYLSKALGRPAKWRDFYRHIHCFSSVILDRLYFLNGHFDDFTFKLFNTDCVDVECVEGRGGFLIGGHLGSFESISGAGHNKPKLNMSLVMYHAHAQKINTMMSAVNRRQNYGVITLGQADSMMKVSEKLDQGGFIGLLADRTFLGGKGSIQSTGSQLRVPFFGQLAAFPKGPFKLAAMLKRPVYMMVGLYRGAGQYDIHFELLYDFKLVHRNRGLAVDEAIMHYAQRLEFFCRLAPYNWFNFFDFWEDGADEPTTK